MCYIHFQGLSGLSMKQFSRNCATTALEYFKVNMPVGKVWRKKPESGKEINNKNNIRKSSIVLLCGLK